MKCLNIRFYMKVDFPLCTLSLGSPDGFPPSTKSNLHLSVADLGKGPGGAVSLLLGKKRRTDRREKSQKGK